MVHALKRGASLASVLVHYPAMTVQVITAIYWHALKLRLKGVPVHTHPEKLKHAPGSVAHTPLSPKRP